jgi:hypothetical protein
MSCEVGGGEAGSRWVSTIERNESKAAIRRPDGGLVNIHGVWRKLDAKKPPFLKKF